MRQDEGIYRFARFFKQLALGLVILVAAGLLFGSIFLFRQVAPEESWRLAERELKGSVLRYGEQPVRSAHVYVRKGTNYFRKAHGLLVATPIRLLFVGIEPKDKLSSPDAPATIITDEFPNDTILELSDQRVYFFSAPGVVVRRNSRRETFAAESHRSAELDSLIHYITAANARQKRDAHAERQLRQQVAEALQRPLYYQVKRGDALLNIASRFGTIPDSIRVWNSLTGDRVRIGDTLLVKPGHAPQHSTPGQNR